MKQVVVVVLLLQVILAQELVEYGHCSLKGTSADSTISGDVYFLVDSDGNVTVVANITGITVNTNSLHGMHIHQFGDVSSQDGSATGSHFIGNGISSHGCPPNARQEGDMGNWNVSSSGTIFETKVLDLLDLSSAGGSIIGRAVVLHATTDNCVNVSSSGSRLAQCVIGVGNPVYWDQVPNNTYAQNVAVNPGQGVTTATCVLQGTANYPGVSGIVYFQQNADGSTNVTATIYGLQDESVHGFHIHEFGDLSDVNGMAAGGHYNPESVFHALPLSATRHVGDMGNINFYNNNTAYYFFQNDKINLNNLNNVIGMSVIVHSGTDDGCSQPTGNAGSRMAQCVIGISSNTQPPTLPPNCCGQQQESDCEGFLRVNNLTLPEGFTIEVYAHDIPYAREMVLSPKGILFVGSMNLDHLNITIQTGVSSVYALVDSNKDFKIDQVYTIIDGLSAPCGVDFRDGSLYVSLVEKILRFDDIENRLSNPPAPVTVVDGYPNNIWHGWKFIRFGPDGYLYVPAGSPCNYCEDTGIFGTMTRVNVTAPNPQIEVIAHGLRNSVGFDWDPQTGDMWFTDNGRDEWGNNRPPDELNHIQPNGGRHFGFPYCYGKDYADPTYNLNMSCAPYVPAAFELGPHVAAVGMTFYRGTMFPKEYQSGRVFIAEHGSWDRTPPLGYRITTVDINNASSYSVFIDGWLQLGDSKGFGDSPEAWGRPTDVINMPDGSILIADDKANAIYRVTYKGKEPSSNKKLKGWEIFLIVAAVLGVVGGAIGVVVFLRVRRHRLARRYNPL